MEPKKRIPRKLKKKIPKHTPYCYTPDVEMQKKMPGVYWIKQCPFYRHLGGIDGWCKLIKHEIEDQCKSCGIN